jgi:hypothetical protein
MQGTRRPADLLIENFSLAKDDIPEKLNARWQMSEGAAAGALSSFVLLYSLFQIGNC